MQGMNGEKQRRDGRHEALPQGDEINENKNKRHIRGVQKNIRQVKIKRLLAKQSVLRRKGRCDQRDIIFRDDRAERLFKIKLANLGVFQNQSRIIIIYKIVLKRVEIDGESDNTKRQQDERM